VREALGIVAGGSLEPARLTDIWRVAATFDDRVAHFRRLLWLAEKFDVNLPNLR